MKVVIVSGYFNPLHGGHLDMIEAARAMGDKLIVIVNNDKQQLMKKGKIILDEKNRLRLMRALRDVNEVVLSIDDYETPDGERPIIKTIEHIAKQHPEDKIIFANGGDRNTEKAIPEAAICNQYGIEMVFGVGTEIRGHIKPESSSRINQETGHEIV
ncbi:MAG: adenylyltransferase/cytidyltransferase family protein [Candidatus Saccharimonadales bacterium]